MGVTGSIGGVGSVSGSVQAVTNYNSGQVSVSTSGGAQFGWNGGAQTSIFAGLVWGLGQANAGYSGGSTGISGSAVLGGFATSTSRGLQGGAPNWNVTSAGLSVGASLIGPTGAVSFTNTSSQVNIGGPGMPAQPLDALMYLLRRLCQ